MINKIVKIYLETFSFQQLIYLIVFTLIVIWKIKMENVNQNLFEKIFGGVLLNSVFIQH